MAAASYPNWVFTLFSGIGFILCCIPFPWHLKGKYSPLHLVCLTLTCSVSAWNTGTCLYMVYSGLGCLGLCINSIIWKGNTNDWAPVWCDICEFEKVFYWDIEATDCIFPVTRVLVIGSFGLPAASLCVNRRIYLIASVRKVTISRAERRRQVAADLAIGLGLPMILLILRENLVSILKQPSNISNLFQDMFIKMCDTSFLKTLDASTPYTSPGLKSSSTQFLFFYLMSSLLYTPSWPSVPSAESVPRAGVSHPFILTWPTAATFASCPLRQWLRFVR